jgi:excisionase family DNA binding protein
MTFKEACRALGLSRSTFQRKIKTGEIRATKNGDGKFAALSFEPSDLGLPIAAPETGPLASDMRADLPMGEPTVPVLNPQEGLPVNERSDAVADVSDDELRARIALGCRPDNPNGVPSNVPALGSSTMPSMENFVRANEARAELLKRELAGRTPVARPRRRIFYRYPDADLAKHNSLVANLGKVD